MSTYTQHYSNFIGVDLSSDPRAVARNRLSYAVNMWRDYESEQGEAIETFPGFRRLVRDLGVVHGLFAYRAKSGGEYLVVHAGTRLYCFESETIAAMDDVFLTEDAALENVTLADKDSQGFIFNNNLYILDGEHFVVVSGVTDESGAVSVTASEIDAYIPTTYFDGKPLEQRNMLVDEAYEVVTREQTEKSESSQYQYVETSPDKYNLGSITVKGFVNKEHDEVNLVISRLSKRIIIQPDSFSRDSKIETVDIEGYGEIDIGEYAFFGCDKLKTVRIAIYEDQRGITNPQSQLKIAREAFYACRNLTTVEVYSQFDTLIQDVDDVAFPEGVSITYKNISMYEPDEYLSFEVSELASDIDSVTDVSSKTNITFSPIKHTIELNGSEVECVKKVIVNRANVTGNLKVRMELSPLHFSTIENVKNFHEGNPDYRGTGVEAINGCTKSAVFDGRIFLTGNPALPNTVFYSHRNLTGANDPTYFGAYNYFNDGDGNTPNVDLLSTPSMLMVLKNNTVQDGSVYYHTPAYNEDEYSKNLVPKVYPSTSGAAGLGSAGKTVPGTTACNFLDDPVFLSGRGLEAVGKQTVNLERTITHRSSNVDRLLIKEDLSRASLAEWKGYLVICCDGRFYLADSRQIHQHPDGSYQYEWYYLEGLGCYDDYSGGYRYLREWPTVDDEGKTLADCTLIDGRTIGAAFEISGEVAEEFNGYTWEIGVYSAQRPDGKQFYFYAHGSLALVPVDEERRGTGEFHPARKIVVVGERLFFGTAGGDVCVINTDKRGIPDYEGQIFESDRISSRWYTFAGVRYPSICVTTLDDCSKKSLAKGTVPGTTVARLKMMPGSRVRVNVSLNGRDFKKLGEAFASRYDIGDAFFDNFSFTENEDSVVVLRELTRNWVDKQYSFVSDGFREPFGLYEISYLYTVNGKIRKIFALT